MAGCVWRAECFESFNTVFHCGAHETRGILLVVNSLELGYWSNSLLAKLASSRSKTEDAWETGLELPRESRVGCKSKRGAFAADDGGISTANSLEVQWVQSLPVDCTFRVQKSRALRGVGLDQGNGTSLDEQFEAVGILSCIVVWQIMSSKSITSRIGLPVNLISHSHWHSKEWPKLVNSSLLPCNCKQLVFLSCHCYRSVKPFLGNDVEASAQSKASMSKYRYNLFRCKSIFNYGFSQFSNIHS